MDRKKASDFHPEVLKLFHGYVHGSLNRRDFSREMFAKQDRAKMIEDLLAAVPYLKSRPIRRAGSARSGSASAAAW